MSVIIIAPDSFKQSLSATKVARAITTGWHRERPDDLVIPHPMADGGEGTMDAILSVLDGEKRIATIQDPLGRSIQASWGWLAPSRTAIIEMAQASGLHLLAKHERNASITSTYGTGQLIECALSAGAQAIILTLGGSATNDAGMGMLKALGVQFYDANHQALPQGGAALNQLAHMDISGLDPRINTVEFIVACDVQTPLYGPEGASTIFAPQKGATQEQTQTLDLALQNFASVCTNTLHIDHAQIPGSGAAGGVGFAALTFFNARFRAGVELVAELTGLPQAMKLADLVITGEGKLDKQTLCGKTPLGVMKLAAALHIPVIALAGTLETGYQQLYKHGLTAAFSISTGPMTFEQTQAQAEELLTQCAANIARLWTVRRLPAPTP